MHGLYIDGFQLNIIDALVSDVDGGDTLPGMVCGIDCPQWREILIGCIHTGESTNLNFSLDFLIPLWTIHSR